MAWDLHRCHAVPPEHDQFAVFCAGRRLKALPDAYIRHLTNGLRRTFHLEGTPLRMLLRGGKNPYAKK